MKIYMSWNAERFSNRLELPRECTAFGNRQKQHSFLAGLHHLISGFYPGHGRKKWTRLPIANGFSIFRIIPSKIDTSVCKLKVEHPLLGAQVTVPNGLIFKSTLWYLITQISGVSFHPRGRLILMYGPAGLGWTDTQSLNASQKTIGLFLVIEQYLSIANNLMLWILGEETHHLRQIVCSHLKDLSCQK